MPDEPATTTNDTANDPHTIVAGVLAEHGASAPEVDTDTLADHVLHALKGASGDDGEADAGTGNEDGGRST